MNKKDVLTVFKVASVYVGTVLGAGFASGQELLQFFARFGTIGIIGLAAVSVIIALTGWAVMDICVNNKILSYSSFMEHILGKKMGSAINLFVMIFIAILLFAMLAGAGATASQAGMASFSTAVIITALICFLTFLFDIKGILKINQILAPILIIGGVFIGIYSVATNHTPVFMQYITQRGWAVSALLYAGYNMVTAIAIISSLGETVSSRKIAKYSGLAGGICMFLIGLFFILPLINNIESVYMLEVPMLEIFRKNGEIIEYAYTFILFAAIFTTAVGNGFVLIEWLYEKTGLNKMIIKILVPLFGAILAHIGFSTIVSQVYPLFGYLGVFEIIVIITMFITSGNLNKRR